MREHWNKAQRHYASGAIYCLAVLASVPACHPGSNQVKVPKASTSPSPDEKVLAPILSSTSVKTPQAIRSSPFRFRDVSNFAKIDFVLTSGNDTKKFFPTSLGSGVAIFDYDGDGKLDLYFATTRNFPLDAPSTSKGNRLYRNLGGFRFEDVTERAKVGFTGFNHGVAVGDVDNNGWPDIYLTNLGGNVLYLNNGDGTFRDASEKCGALVKTWSSGAAFLDYDGDGKLDLYVTCYGVWTERAPHEFCGDLKRGLRVFCSPFSITPQRHYLFKGHGDGTFEETTASAGIMRKDGRGLGVVSADVNGDGKTDLYVANDGCPNFLFINNGDGTFEDASESSGAATNEAGEVQGSMGVDIQDIDGDGKPELFVSNFRGQADTLYRNLDGRNFQDVSAAAGFYKDTLPYVGWGCALADFDCDGKPDIFVVNGEIDDNLPALGQSINYLQPILFFRNIGNRRFERVLDPGPGFRDNQPARGAAFGDLDNDGDLDVVVTRMDMSPMILSNESERGNWIRFDLAATRSNRSAIGTTVDVFAEGKRFQRQRKGGDSYLSVNDPRLHVGLGAVKEVDRVEVLWPGGARSVLKNPAMNTTHRLVELEAGP